uniref:Uncharacterized protein n=1 Tax=Anopheles culicifacies TaxID=139723 RepID=A0A182LWP2_9DIPT
MGESRFQRGPVSNRGVKSGMVNWWEIGLPNGMFSRTLKHNNFYFAQSQGRFVPSFENPRNGFFPSALQRQQPPQPDSYQEQTLFVNSNNVDRGNGANEGAAGTRGITPSYYQFTYTVSAACSFPASP